MANRRGKGRERRRLGQRGGSRDADHRVMIGVGWLVVRALGAGDTSMGRGVCAERERELSALAASMTFMSLTQRSP